MKLLIVLCSILAVSQALNFFEVVKEEWEFFKLQHKKHYTKIEEKFRLRVFAINKYKILRHNARHLRDEVKYKLRMNEFGDLLHHEFVQLKNGFRHLLNESQKLGSGSSTFVSAQNVQLPEYIDWRQYGAVTPVKMQGQCGACWSFSATGALEGQHFRKTGKLVSLSEQNLIDCSGSYGNHGCNGGAIVSAFQYVKDNGGIDTEASYPYEAQQGQCRYDAKNSGATDTGYIIIQAGNETHLKEAVATVGPISAAIDASHLVYQFYHTGVYHEPQCNSTALNHGVLVVGYGVDKDTHEDYWLIKNSWGPTWGDNGYMKLARNHDNHCGIATMASYPSV